MVDRVGRLRRVEAWKKVFIYADGIYASACVVAYFHLAHFFQVNSTLGPLQLSLYKMLRDVLKFLAIFLLLYFAFATGVAKIYSYYVASQIELQKRDTTTTDHQVSHPLALWVFQYIFEFFSGVVLELGFGFKLLLNTILFRA